MNKNLARTWLIGLLFLLLTASFNSFSADAFLATATRTSTRIPTLSLTKALSTPTPFTDSFYRLLSWGGGGAGGGIYYPGMGNHWCSDKDFPKLTPAVLSISDRANDYGYLCLFDFKPNEQITISFKSPNGKADAVGIFNVGKIDTTISDTSSLIYQISPSLGDIPAGYMSNISDVKGKRTIAELVFWKPIGIPEGIWDVAIKTKSIYLKTKMNVGWPKTEPRLGWEYHQPSILDRAPFLGSDIIGEKGQIANSGDKNTIQILNLKPNQTYSVGIYNRHSGVMDLNNEYTFLADKFGKHQADFSATQKNSPGFYVVAILRPKPEVLKLAEFYGLTTDDLSSEFPLGLASYDHDCIRVRWQACPNAPNSGLEKGLSARINPLNPTLNSIRSKSGLNNKLIGTMKIDEWADILDGPQCADNMVWWKIKTYSGIIGWAAEGQGNWEWLNQKVN
jgi:hypothetical protein